jgi:hypothetical protein
MIRPGCLGASFWIATAGLVASLGCTGVIGNAGTGPDATPGADAAGVDASIGADASTPPDAGMEAPDAAERDDAGRKDGGAHHPDAAEPPDAGTIPPDAGQSLCGADAGPRPDAGTIQVFDVLQHHLNSTRDGFYVDGYMTRAAIPNLHVDPNFKATTSAQTFAQPLYMTNGAGGVATVFVATNNNDVYALNAMTGAQIWTTNLGANVPLSEMSCGNIDPRGAVGTPVIDPASRLIFVAPLVNGGTGNTTPTYMVFALSIDTGKVQWSLDVAATISGFTTTIQGQRSALSVMNGTVYVPYGGLYGDCGPYHGWVIAIPETNPTTAKGWATSAPSGAGIWGPSGAASDGTSLYVATGNTNADPSYPTVWSQADSEGVLKLTPGNPPSFSGANTDYFAPSGSGGMDWYNDDTADADLGSSGVVLLDVPNANPGHLAFAIGKTQTTYILDRTNLGGINNGLQTAPSVVYGTNNDVMGSLFAYSTQCGSYFGLQETVNNYCNSGDVSVFQITSSSQLSFAWCATGGGAGGPIASTSGGNWDVVVWTYGASGDETVRAYDGDLGGTPIVTVSGLPGSEHWISPIIAGGRMYIAADGAVTALTVQ